MRSHLPSRYLPTTIGLLLAVLLLAGCSGGTAREILGFERNAPDEFAVVARPPLSVPPDFALRPPTPGAEPTQSTPSDLKARAALTGEESVSNGGEAVSAGPLSSPAESTLLERAGALRVDPQVRDKLRDEDYEHAVKQEEQQNSGWFDFGHSAESDAPVIDAKKEAERIRANKEAGKPVNEGQVPVEQESDGGVLRDLF